MPLTNLYCLYNRRARSTNLISPNELLAACREISQLPHSSAFLRRFDSGLLVVQDKGVCDEKVAEALSKLSQERTKGGKDGSIDILDVSKALGCPAILGNEYLKRGEELGFLCRDESIEGVKFHHNRFPLF
jgi:hypothetical protein